MTLSRRTLVAALATTAATLLLPGCRRSPVIETPDDVPAGWSLQPGHVDPSLSSVQAIATPPTVRVGEPFTLIVRSYGSGSCTRADGERVERSGGATHVTPLDWEAPAGTPCTRDLRYFAHEVTLRFDEPGDARIVIHARDRQHRLVAYDHVVQVVR